MKRYTPKSLQFRFYSKKDKPSTIEITSPVTFDNFNHPLPNGLYDPRLGPINERAGACLTCQQTFFDCPGHFGFIKIDGVINPLCYDILALLLNSMCMSCERFKCNTVDRLIFYGQLIVVKKGGRKEMVEDFYRKKNNEEESSEEEIEYDKYKALNNRIDSLINNLEESSLNYNSFHNLILRFLKNCSALKKCHNCWTKSFHYKKDNTKTIARNGSIILIDEMYKNIKGLYKNEKEILELCFDDFHPSMFFIRELQVSPNKFRPVSYMNNKQFESPINEIYRRILKNTKEEILDDHKPVTTGFEGMSKHLDNEFNNKDIDDSSESSKSNEITTEIPVQTGNEEQDHQKRVEEYIHLQNNVCTLFDSTNKNNKMPINGIKQVLEKKEGLFRKHLMGKRVNHAARSVISPDPHLHTREIGIPTIFAETLVFPERVTDYNYEILKKAVISGSTYPGARYLETLQNGNHVKYDLSKLTEQRRSELSNRLLLNESTVYRHMKNNDIVLVNRQPTLHKPSIMAHRVRVLPGEKTIRMHYANCNSYNADFDGDEMNVHFLQDHLARAEGYLLMSNDHNYLVGTDGSPVRGLVQDHIVVCARLCLKGDFMSREEFYHYIVECSTNKVDHDNKYGFVRHEETEERNPLYIDEDYVKDDSYYIPPPVILRPVKLYSGKQIISSILRSMNIRIDHKGKSKLSSIEDGEVIFKDGILVKGIIDKNQIGPTRNGLIHKCGEKYGYSICNELLTTFGRVINKIMIRKGYSARIDDLLLENDGDEFREMFCRDGISDGMNVALNEFQDVYINNNDVERGPLINIDSRINNKERYVHKQDSYINGSINDEFSMLDDQEANNKRIKKKKIETHKNDPASNKQIMHENNIEQENSCDDSRTPKKVYIDPKNFVNDRNKITPHGIGLKDPFYFTDPHQCAILDSIVKTEMNKVTSKVIEIAITQNQYKPFPYNNYALMIMSGAKGSIVNLGQISGLLGQQELEGKRVPITISGSTLPSFKANDLSPRAGGYIFGRFLDGINPSEYFFHCMAGREGLIDTAVKTARSGYLQRCLIKGLEGCIVEYDYSVRQNGRIIQFIYGENIETINSGSFFSSPGEAVGILAAQSVGEPSTQMTLNTFHLAGVGSKNVTLGIPRLVEILMVAGKTIKTPVMKLELIDSQGEEILKKVTRITLKDITRKVTIHENMNEYNIELLIEGSVNEKEVRKKISRMLDILIKKKGRIGVGVLKQEKKLKENEEEEIKVEEQDDSSDKFSDQDEVEEIIENDDEEEKQIEGDDNDSTENDEQIKPDNNNETIIEECFEKELLAEKNNILEGDDLSSFSFTFTTTNESNVLLLPLIEKVLPMIVVKEWNGIKSATFSDKTIVLEGSDIYALIGLFTTEEIRRCYSNDIYSVQVTLGLEAARNIIVNEIRSVFDVYGINVDAKHLMLIADFMTVDGDYKPFNRHGMKTYGSLLQKMCFESCYTCLKETVIFGDKDDVKTPSSELCLGKNVSVGSSASFDLLYSTEDI